MVRQLPLNLTLRDGSSFANFVAGPNAEARAQVQLAAEGRSRHKTLFLSGDAGTGKSHLLQAACRRAQERGESCAYVAFGAVIDLSPEVLEDREEALLICLDEVERIGGRDDWQHAVFALYERQRARDGVLIAAGRRAPNALGLGMPELATRLASGPVYELHGLSDDDKVMALQRRIHNRGLEMPEDVGRYILSRYPRNMNDLFALLDRIDQASLASQRRLTIPFIRTLE